jgi:predicted ATP-dependent serine protease
MRPPVDDSSIRSIARELGRIARAPVRIYLTGGSTAVIEGWRQTTVDVDMRLEPEADELLRALPALKNRFGINMRRSFDAQGVGLYVPVPRRCRRAVGRLRDQRG